MSDDWKLESWHERQEQRTAEVTEPTPLDPFTASPLHRPTASPSLPEGRKDDDGKARFDLLPPDALWEVVRVYTAGAGKYGDRNWEKGIRYGRVFAAICRHAFSWWRGERADEETGIHHLAHAAWNCLALLAYELRGMEEFDDRKAATTPE